MIAPANWTEEALNESEPITAAETAPFVTSFARGLSVIRSFSDGHEAQSLSDIAKRTGMTRATARRLIHTLADLGYARADGRRFYLTARILELGYSYLSSANLWTMVQPDMETVVAQTGASCSISVLDNDDIIYVARVSPQQLMQRVINIGSRVPAHAVAMGRILLAQLGDDELWTRIQKMNLHPFTSRTITDREKLFEAIKADRERGWSLIDREFDDGISGIGMVIRDGNGKALAAANLSLSPEKVQQAEVLETLRTNLTDLTARIEDIARNKASSTDTRPSGR